MRKPKPLVVLMCLLGSALRLTATEGEAQRALQRGLAAFRAGKLDDALGFFNTSVEKDPALLSARFWRGRASAEKQVWRDAEQDFRRVLEAKLESVESLYWLGYVLEAQGHLREALDCYGKALRIDPQRPESIAGRQRGQALQKLLPPPQSPPGVSPRAAALWQKLANAQEVTAVVLGDSLSFGMGVKNSQADAFPFLLQTMLQEQFANPCVRVIDAGVAGETSAQGLWRLEAHVLAQKPDLLIVQFGGNDSQKLSLDDYRRHLRAIVEQTRAESQAEVLLATPPMEVKEPDSPFVKAAREVGTETQIPVADFDAALRRAEHDYRGFFPNFSHPNEYGHALMAQELLRAFRQLVNQPEALEVTLEGKSGWVTLGTDLPVSIRLRNLLQEAQSGELSLTAGATRFREPFDLAGQEVKEWGFSLPLPAELPAGRSLYQRLQALARSPQGAAFDFKWLTLAPRLECPVLEQEPPPPPSEEKAPDAPSEHEAAPQPPRGPEGEPKSQSTEEPEAPKKVSPPAELRSDGVVGLPRMALGEAHVVEGRARWDGPEDLRAVFAASQDTDMLRFQVEVTDDRLITGGSLIPAYNDGVELFFDLRPLTERGRPFYTPQVFLVFLHPPSRRGGRPSIIPLDAPAGVTETWQVQGKRSPHGYSLTVTIPCRWLEGVAGGPLTSLGFDVAVDDADTVGERQTQLMWAGTEHNFGNPRGLGELVVAGKKEAGTPVRMSLW